MPVQETIDAIEHAKSELRISRETYGDEENWREAHTRYVVIDPILRAMGWRTDSTSQCEVEMYAGERGKKVDYALLNRRGYVVVLIEAKRLEGNLSDNDEEQLLSYVRYLEMEEGLGVLTNGVKWCLYTLETDNIVKVACVNIIREQPGTAARRLHKWLNRGKWR